MNNDDILGILCAGGCGFLLLAAVALLVIGTVMKTRFGINVFGAECAECGASMPIVRVPQNTYQTLWGGWTCEKCGSENDKWGNPV